jgi:glycosyltransferase involved in cell wall biosynthesis
VSDDRRPGYGGVGPQRSDASICLASGETAPADRTATFQRVAVIHNYYQQAGGEDEAFRSEVELLTAHGHEVFTYTLDNSVIDSRKRLRLARDTIWNSRTCADLRAHFRATKPTIAHFHNTFPLVSPAAYYAARAEGVAVVQTLHNFRLSCLNALFYRDGRICEDCLGRSVAWPGVLHACYRRDRGASGVVAAMLAAHRAAGTWRNLVGAYIALSHFARSKFLQAGLPPQRLHVKPNFLPFDPGVGGHDRGFALYVGRLSAEKGLNTLLRSWAQAGNGRSLKIVGTGPYEHLAAEHRAGVEWVGWLPRERVLDLMKEAAFLVLPSECYENFPVTLVEAFATGLPVIGSSGGSVGELIEDFVTGRLCPPGNVDELAKALQWAHAYPEQVRTCGERARAEFLEKYTSDRNYAQLLDVYRRAAGR